MRVRVVVRAMWLMMLIWMVSTAAWSGAGQWKTYTAKRDVRDIALDRNGILWVATSGGMFSYRSDDSAFTEYTTSEGLRTIDLSAITVDNQGIVWIGAVDGFLHSYNPLTHEWRYITDIFRKLDPQKRINALRVYGDTLFILSDLGVSVFSTSRMEFGDTYGRFGTGATTIVGGANDLLLMNGLLWVATTNGIARASLTTSNLSAPESWQVFTTSQGLPSNVTRRLILDYYDTLFAATSDGVAKFDGTSWQSVAGTIGLNVNSLSATHNECLSCPQYLYLVTPSEIWSYSRGVVQKAASGFNTITTPIAELKFMGTSNGVIVFDNTSNFTGQTIFPSGPPSNSFVGIAVDEHGVVWSGTGGTGIEPGNGFMSFDGTTWKAYTASQDARLVNNNYYKVSIGKDNAKWVCNWGVGVALVDDGGRVQKVLGTANGIPPTIGSNFVVVGGVATDGNGVSWITNRSGPGNSNNISVVQFLPDSTLGYVAGCGPNCNVDGTNPNYIFLDLVIDGYGTKWFTNLGRFEPFGISRSFALCYYNENFQLSGTVNGWGKLTTSDGLTSDQIWSLAVDDGGELWVGTDQGIAIIFDPSNPQSHIAAYHPLPDQVIQAIVVDPLNNKWVATKQGVFVLSSDGTSILERYTVENTNGKLLDNDVTSLGIDKRTGIMYFGTEKGLSSLRTAGVQPNNVFDGLTFAPNPFYIPSASTLLVNGLVQNSTLKVLSIDGNLIREVKTPGGKIGFWDGKDERGQLASTGIYLVVAYSEDGTKVATGKVAVIRR